MQHNKQFYKNLPNFNGYKWAFFDYKKHCFIKGNNQYGFISIYLYDLDIDCINNFKLMLNKNLTRT